MGLNRNNIKALQIGWAFYNILYVYKDKDYSFILLSGIHGAVSVNLLTSELAALGVKKIIHIGICGVFGKQNESCNFLISLGSYKDHATMLMSNNYNQKIVYSDTTLSNGLYCYIKRYNNNTCKGFGYTMPSIITNPKGVLMLFYNGRVVVTLNQII